MSAEPLESHSGTQNTLLRFSTAGSVDDGKSTLVGRLLHDSKNLLDDQLDALQRASEKHEKGGALSLALVTDGLRAEREQGITIDVAYRYFATQKRRFILADTPGHVQYTRNMATGASNSDLTIVLVDAKQGVVTQTRRHAFISSLLGVPRILVAINKMDLVDYSQEVFESIRQNFLEFAEKLTTTDIRFVPISALRGDNVVDQSTAMPWFHGETILDYLENVYIGGDRNRVDFRLPVQLIIRGESTYRGYAGQISSGVIRQGEEVLILPSMRKSRVRSIDAFPYKRLSAAVAPQSVVVTLEDEIDISRGDMLVRPGNLPHIQSQFEAMVVWMSERPMDQARQYLVMHTTRNSKVSIDAIRYRIDVNTLSRHEGRPLELNEIGRIAFTSARPLFFDTYGRNRATGNFILIDGESFQTVAAGMFIDSLPEELLTPTTSHGVGVVNDAARRNLHEEKSGVSRMEREAKSGNRAITLWCTGLSGSGKSTIAKGVEKSLFDGGIAIYRLDGDNVRLGLNRDLGFSNRDRAENIRRVAEVARLMNDAGVSVICSFISPFQRDRELAREIIGKDSFIEVYLSTPLESCEARDPHGLYKKARSGELKEFTGVNAPYEAPLSPEISLRTDSSSLEECIARVVALFHERSRE